jgi:hypothetical protein
MAHKTSRQALGRYRLVVCVCVCVCVTPCRTDVRMHLSSHVYTDAGQSMSFQLYLRQHRVQ